MILTYHGKSFVKATLGNTTLAFSPIGKDSDMKGARFGADMALVSANHDDYNGADQVAYGDTQPFVIEGPGEYELAGTFIKGFSSKGPKGGINTIYKLEFDSMKLVHLGALSSADLDPHTLEALGEIDILFVPVYGGEVLTVGDAHKLATRLDPKVIVPLYYGGDKNDALAGYLKEAGEKNLEAVDKYTVKKKDIETFEGETIVIKSF